MDNPLEHLEFALKHEGVNLSIMSLLFKKSNPEAISQFILEKATSKYRRKIWFYFEKTSRRYSMRGTREAGML